MSVASPPRPASARSASANIVEDRPLRHPDSSSREMMTRRGWWLVLLNFLLPGSAQAVAGNRRLGKVGLGATLVMWGLLILGVLSALLWPTGAFSLLAGAWLPEWLSLLRPVPLTLDAGVGLALVTSTAVGPLPVLHPASASARVAMLVIVAASDFISCAPWSAVNGCAARRLGRAVLWTRRRGPAAPCAAPAGGPNPLP